MNTRPDEVVLATRSAGKRDELRELFRAVGIVVRDLAELDVGEDPAEGALEVHATFEENARAKALWFAERLPRRMIVADDSGLEVDFLRGAPGVRSKRWARSAEIGPALDRANNTALVHALQGASERAARYVCVVVALGGDTEWVARGECRGRITEFPSGDGGFGYDPYFLSDELGKTFGDATREEKGSVSHRGRAFRALLAQWSDERK